MLVFWRFGYSIETIGYCAFLAWLLSLSLIDLDTMTLPAPPNQVRIGFGIGISGSMGVAASSRKRHPKGYRSAYC